MRKNFIEDVKKLQNHYVITYSDKAVNNFVIIYKIYYYENLKQIMNSKTNYELCKITDRELISRLKAKHLQLGCNQRVVKFPYVFIMPKFHKVQVKFRTIASSYNTYNVKFYKKL